MPNSGINPLSSGTGHLPGLNATTNLNSYLIGSGSQLQSIQNQSQQLPPFNSIQNKLPSPPTTQTMLNMSNTNAMVNSVFNISSLTANINNSGTTAGTALMPLLATSNTLNPSHLFKTSSNSKNNMLFGTTTSSGNNLLNELKLSNSQYGTQSSTPQQFANNSFSASFGLGQLGSSRDTTAGNSGNPGANSGTNAGGTSSASVNGISSSILNNIGSFNDSGW
ncbi:uncharacterized protein SPAPADRAFT_60297 [Spathaspora passalidarum NRRL Y-27907]|uniref:Uncharacterized protein n=1 Tax=Spathaspora passalidarum (strain NRRL Y-27907 / 11-Y1) TaxID=619300 RepID=G3AKR1_SPAPN|nr:uncharacterized protein SPAPADRAFT_60297 [Spathaspora passalidarum NRRL Y-27907]EGW32965.1 hypothetical protein SPAPADRAFT_60297 [Spathaspora passalidarum NRRL Y-27907]